MPAGTCTCGFQATDCDELSDHLHELFTPEDDKDASGQVHAEASRDHPSSHSAPVAVYQCLCGFTAGDVTGIDDHLLSAFTPADSIGHDGDRHVPVTCR
jgi:hypothetical protein